MTQTNTAMPATNPATMPLNNESFLPQSTVLIVDDNMQNVELLQAFLDAFNAHDLDAIMAFFTEDCVFDTPRGPALMVQSTNVKV